MSGPGSQSQSLAQRAVITARNQTLVFIQLNLLIARPKVTSSEVMSASSSRTSLNRCLSWRIIVGELKTSFCKNEDKLEFSAKQMESLDVGYYPFPYLSRSSSLVSRGSPGARSGSEGASTRSVVSRASVTPSVNTMCRSGWTVVRVGEETDENKQEEDF